MLATNIIGQSVDWILIYNFSTSSLLYDILLKITKNKKRFPNVIASNYRECGNFKCRDTMLRVNLIQHGTRCCYINWQTKLIGELVNCLIGF